MVRDKAAKSVHESDGWGFDFEQTCKPTVVVPRILYEEAFGVKTRCLLEALDELPSDGVHFGFALVYLAMGRSARP